MKITNVFDDFCGLLKSRTGMMTEDNVRYYWFASMLKQDVCLNDYTLEYPYGKLVLPSSTLKSSGNEELDLFYHSGSEELCFEMKFHRESASSFADTRAAGAVFNDLQRLREIISGNGRKKYFLYVTDNDVDKYFNTTKGAGIYRSELRDFYEMKPGTTETVSFKQSDVPKTFWDAAHRSFSFSPTPLKITVKLLKIADEVVPSCETFTGTGKNCHVRLYEVIS